MKTAPVALLALSLAACTLPGCIAVNKTETAAMKSADLDGAQAAVDSFFAAWTKREGEVFTTERLGRVVANSDQFLSFDGMAPKTVIKGWNEYSATWGPGMNQFTSATLSAAEPISLTGSGSMAVWCGIASIKGNMPDGSKRDMPGHLTLVLSKQSGQWRIVHEHMSLGVKR
jgi:ketosteroid isomerase-like protein